MYSSHLCRVRSVVRYKRKFRINKEKVTNTGNQTQPLFLHLQGQRFSTCARVCHSWGPCARGSCRLSPSAALIRAIIKSRVNWCWSKHRPLSSLRTSVHFSLCIPLNGGRTSIINLQHPGDESSVKERESETERQAGGGCNLEKKKRKSKLFLYWSSWWIKLMTLSWLMWWPSSW